MSKLSCCAGNVFKCSPKLRFAARACKLIGFVMVSMAGFGTAFSQEEGPVATAAPVDSTEYTAVIRSTPRIPGNPSDPAESASIDQGYRSQSLRGYFLAQWMYIDQGGRRTTFWGARILRLDADSPLRTLGLRQGDVITRLDGLPIWRGMYKEEGQEWQIIELENHFGHTEVRYIVRGTHQVRVGQINIDTSSDDVAPLPP